MVLNFSVSVTVIIKSCHNDSKGNEVNRVTCAYVLTIFYESSKTGHDLNDCNYFNFWVINMYV